MNILMTICAESIYIIENLLIVFGLGALLEYKGKNVKAGIAGQVIFIYLFQKVSTPVSLYLVGGAALGVIVNIIMVYTVSIVCYKGVLFRRIFAIVMYLGPALTAEAIVWPLMHAIVVRVGGVDASYEDLFAITEYRNLAIILCGQMILILWVMMLLLWKICTERWWIKEYVLFIVIPIYQMIIFLIYYGSCEKIDTPSIIIGWLLYLFGIVIDVAILYLITGMLKKMQMEKELNDLYQKRQKELEYYVSVNNHMEEVRELRHEFANQLQVIYGLMEEKDTGRVRKMLDATYENMESKFLND